MSALNARDKLLDESHARYEGGRSAPGAPRLQTLTTLSMGVLVGAAAVLGASRFTSPAAVTMAAVPPADGQTSELTGAISTLHSLVKDLQAEVGDMKRQAGLRTPLKAKPKAKGPATISEMTETCSCSAGGPTPCVCPGAKGGSRLVYPTDDYTNYENGTYASPYGYPPRDMIGYGRNYTTFQPKWPGGAKLALSFVMNYEEGGENCVLHGDEFSENLLSEIVGERKIVGERNMNMESLYEYGSRAGFWRVHKLFKERGMVLTVFAVAMALSRNPDVAKAMVEAGFEVATHGYRWIDYQNVPEEEERKHIKAAVEIQKRVVGYRPMGIYQGKPNERTRRLIIEEGGFLWDADAYSDDLPFWNFDEGKPWLIIPYTLTNNDMVFVRGANFPHEEAFFLHLAGAFDQLLKEGREGTPKMMNVGLHCRIVGQPGRAIGLARFLDYVKKHGDEVWVTTRTEIAKHWHKHHYPTKTSGWEQWG